jgi:purine-binding chemotaxis protein CheW
MNLAKDRIHMDYEVATRLKTATARARVEGGASTPLREFLAFKLGDEEYGIDILCVQEIRPYERATKMANTPEFIKGVVNLRGTIIPILDMRIKFNLPRITYDTSTVVIVLNIGSQIVGMVVDGVSDVIGKRSANPALPLTT